jgi:REP element-mobilizing transposase RayT
MGDTFSNLVVHLVFSTKSRLPLLTKTVREDLYPYMGGIVRGVGGVTIAIGGTTDHIHILARIPTKVSVADFARAVKGNSSKWMNERFTNMRFGWQRGYGAFSVSRSAISRVVEYVRDQEQHHRHRSFLDELKMLLKKHEISYDERYL